jgi:hypothetical protein
MKHNKAPGILYVSHPHLAGGTPEATREKLKKGQI